MVFADWVSLALLASALGGFTIIIDKVLLTKYAKDWIYLTAFLGVIVFLPFLIFPFFINIFTSVIFIGILAGVFFRLAVFSYMKALSFEEASRVIPLWLMSPIFVLVLERIFLEEQLFLHHYAGMFAVIAGSFIIMTRSVKGLFRLSPAFYLMILSGIIFAFNEVIMKFAFTISDFFPVIFWTSAGSMLTSVPFLLFKFKKRHRLFYRKDKLSLILPAGVILFFASIITYWYAIKLGPVSMVSTLGSADGLFVFFYAIIFTKFAPSVLKEAIDRKTLLTKAAAIAIIIAGVFLINGGV